MRVRSSSSSSGLHPRMFSCAPPGIFLAHSARSTALVASAAHTGSHKSARESTGSAGSTHHATGPIPSRAAPPPLCARQRCRCQEAGAAHMSAAPSVRSTALENQASPCLLPQQRPNVGKNWVVVTAGTSCSRNLGIFLSPSHSLQITKSQNHTHLHTDTGSK